MSTHIGRFVWHELHTGDRAKAMKFYAQLVGWQIKDTPMGPGEPYGMCFADGKDAAGITKSMAPAGVPPHWLLYVGVEDVDAAAKKVEELGGKVQGPPMDIPNVGRFAVVSDPQGAVFALFRGAMAAAAEPERPAMHTFCWDELMTTDPAAATKFYTALLGYSVETQDMGPAGTYTVLKRGDRQTAGIMKTPPNVPMPPAWGAYLQVENVDRATRNAREIGATVLVEPQDIPKIGRFSVIADPTGAVVSLFTGSM